MSNEFRKEIILTWFNRAKKIYSGPVSGMNPGLFWADGLIYAWISFDAFTSLYFPHFRVIDRNNDFAASFQTKYENHNFSDRFKKARLGIRQYSILDMRPGSTAQPFQISNADDLKEILEAIYRVRCNLFHGGKEVNEEKDKDLIQFAFELLYELLEIALIKEEIIS